MGVRARLGAALLSALFAAVGVLTPVPGAARADGVGGRTYDLAGGPSFVAPFRYVTAADTEFVLSTLPDDTVVATPVAGGADIVLPRASGLGSVSEWDPYPRFPSLAGSLVTSMLTPGVVTFVHIGGSWGTRAVSGRYLGAAPQGWLELRSQEIFVVDADSGVATDVGAVPEGVGAVDFARSDRSHYVISALGYRSVVGGSSTRARRFLVFAAGAPREPNPPVLTAQTWGCLDSWDGDACHPWYFAFGGNAMVIVDGSQTVERVPLDGSATTVIHTPANVVAYRAAATATETGFYGFDFTNSDFGEPIFDTAPAAGTALTERVGNGMVVGDGASRFYTDSPPDLSVRGLAVTEAAGAPSTLLQLDPPVPVSTADLQVTSGWVVWNDDEHSQDTLMMRSFASSPDSDALGPATMAERSGFMLVGLAQRRAILTTGAGQWQWLMTSSGHTVAPLTLPASDQVVQISGTRALTRDEASDDVQWRVWDLVTGVASPLFSAYQPSIWGNYLAYANDAGAIYRVDLTGRTPTRLVVGPPTGGVFSDGQIYVAGDYVAWTRDSSCTTGGGCQVDNGFRNVTHEGPLVTLTHPPFALSDSYLGTDNDTGQAVAVNLASGDQTVLEDSGWLDANVLAWGRADGRPQQEPMLTVLPDVGVPGRLLGRSGAPTVLTRGMNWHAELDASRALTSCSIDISHDGQQVRQLPCEAGLIRYGSAVVDWDLRDGAGAVVPDGAYTWTLHAADAAGPIVDYDGAARGLSGQILLRHPVAAMVTPPHTRTGYWTIRFSGDVHGITSRDLFVKLKSSGATVHVKVTCYRSRTVTTSCARTFRYVKLRPTRTLAKRRTYRVVLNPTSSKAAIADRFGIRVTAVHAASWRSPGV